VFLLPRRVKRDARIARGILRGFWGPWRTIAGRISPAAADTMLGIHGPLEPLSILGVLSAGVIACYAGFQWASSVHLGGTLHPSFGEDLYFSGGVLQRVHGGANRRNR
jgi:hypothetical protein